MQSVIQFNGTLSRTGNSQGHYTCDVKARDSNSWFRTNDNSAPMPLNVNEVSQNGYVVLYKKILDYSQIVK